MRWTPLLGLALLPSVGCGDDTPEALSPEALSALAAPGPHAVGFRVVELGYVPPTSTVTRALQTLVWYPATHAGAGERPTYLVRTSEHAERDAPPVGGPPRPVVLFSHGHQAYAAVMSHLMEHFASHGFIAVAPTHTGNTFLDGDRRGTPIYYQRPLDISAALDALDDGRFAGVIGAATDRRMLIGHSFGAYTAYALAGATFDLDRVDEQCAAGEGPASFCSDLDPAQAAVFSGGLGDLRLSAFVGIEPGDFDLFGAAGVSMISAPVLHLVAEKSEPDPYAPALADPVAIRLRGGDHNDFVDSCGYDISIRCSDLPPPEVRRGLNALTLAFSRLTLGAESDLGSVLAAPEQVSSLFEAMDP